MLNAKFESTYQISNLLLIALICLVESSCTNINTKKHLFLDYQTKKQIYNLQKTSSINKEGEDRKSNV